MTERLTISRSVFNESHWRGNDRKKGILIRSEEFPGELRYVVKKNGLAILAGGNGIFCLDLAAGYQLGGEIIALADCYDRSDPDKKPKTHLDGREFFSEILRAK